MSSCWSCGQPEGCWGELDNAKQRITALEKEKEILVDTYEAGLLADRERIAELEALLRRYRDETPIGHQPNMIAHKVDELLGDRA
jgi:hypothetical protein